MVAVGSHLFAQQSVVISELVASNETGIEDEDGYRQDWIELANFGDAGVVVGRLEFGQRKTL